MSNLLFKLNKSPYLTHVRQSSTPSPLPAVGEFITYFRNADGHLCKVDSTGAIVDIETFRIDTVSLTAVQVKALFTTPISLAVAPGAGKITIVDRITFGSTFGTIAYAGANNLEFRYTGAAGAKVTADIAAATLNFAAGTKYGTVAGVTAELAAVANAAIMVCVPVANPTAGDSPVKFTIEYHYITLP